jgi:superfamily II DNA or RNA helicase
MLDQDFYNTREGIVVDEWHHSASNSYHKIFNMCDHIYYRYGMTGTFFRSGFDAMSMHALLSNTIYSISSLELLKRGYLVPIHAVFLPVPCESLRNLGSRTFQSGHGKYGIHEHFIRNFVVGSVSTMLQNTGRRVLILVGTKKQGYKIKEIIEGMLPPSGMNTRFDSVEFLSTDRDRNIQEKVIDSFLDGEEVKILIGTSILGEGVDLPTADALVYARGEKAEVTLTQNMYRVGTAIEGKDHAVVVDFADRHHRKLLEHSMERARVYYNEPTFSVQMLNNLNDFPKWLGQLVPNFG